MSEPLHEMDAFELRWQLVHGLHPSDGLVVHVVNEDVMMVVGTDSTPHPKHGIYLATGRTVYLWRLIKFGSWFAKQSTGDWHGREHAAVTISDLDADLAWVRQRSDT